MRAYRRLQLLLASIFAGYLVLAVTEVVYGEKGSAFPVFSWALFERVPDRTLFYAARVHSLDGRELRPARDLPDLEQSLPGAASLNARASVQDLGRAISSGDEEHIAALRRALEQVALRGRRMRYEIEERAYDDPRDAWRGGTPVSTRALGVFTTKGSGE